MARGRRAPRSRLLWRRLRGDRRGAGAVEFAFIAPLAILVTLGAIETGRALSAQATINHAVKETARFAAVRGTASGAEATQSQLEDMALDIADLPLSKTTAAASWDPDNSPGGIVTVTMQHTFNPVTIPFEAETFTFNATASMTIVR